MKTVVESVRIRTSDGVEKSIKIRDEKYNMKYNFLIKLAEDGVLVWDGAAQRAFLEIMEKYASLGLARNDALVWGDDTQKILVEIAKKYVKVPKSKR